MTVHKRMEICMMTVVKVGGRLGGGTNDGGEEDVENAEAKEKTR